MASADLLPQSVAAALLHRSLVCAAVLLPQSFDAAGRLCSGAGRCGGQRAGRRQRVWRHRLV